MDKRKLVKSMVLQAFLFPLLYNSWSSADGTYHILKAFLRWFTEILERLEKVVENEFF